MKMRLSLRIPLGITITVFMLGFIISLKTAARGEPVLTPLFFVWIVATLILAGITIWSWQRGKKK